MTLQTLADYNVYFIFLRNVILSCECEPSYSTGKILTCALLQSVYIEASCIYANSRLSHYIILLFFQGCPYTVICCSVKLNPFPQQCFKRCLGIFPTVLLFCTVSIDLSSASPRAVTAPPISCSFVLYSLAD